MLGDEQRRENWDAIHRFAKYWRRRDKFPDYRPHVFRFPCVITYSARGRVRSVNSQAIFMVPDGRVEISEAKWLNVDDYHLGVDVSWQVFTFTRGKALRVEGSSDKAGDYWIEIVPK